MTKDLLVLADEYAAATATFARALALKDGADSMSPIARDAGDKRAVLAEALAALDTAQPVQVNAMLVGLLEPAFTEIQHVLGSTLELPFQRKSLETALELLRTALTAAKQAQPVRPINCGTGHCSCIECPYEQAQPEPFAPDWSQDSAAAESIREHQAICNLLLKEMRHIAGISTGQVKRVAEQALKATKQAQPDLIPQESLFVCGQMGANVTKVYAEQAQPERGDA